MSLDRAVAMIATHLGVVDENQINEMSYVFFESVLEELGFMLNYQAVANYAGNAFCKDSWELIKDSNPFNVDVKTGGKRKTSTGIASFLSQSKIQIMGK